jgi:putative methyltransferase (TIGR04325 family)
MHSFVQGLRIRQVQLTSRMLVYLGRSPSRARVIQAVRRFPPARALLHLLTGYQRPFATLAQAEAAIKGLANGGHQHPELAQLHLERNAIARPSDYAALFHLRDIMGEINRVYDLGGSVGNLYYCYSSYLEFPAGLVWQVNDLPVRLAAAARVAEQRQAHQVALSSAWEDAEGADLLIASGSLHYFPTPLPDMVANLASPPRYILINRTPFTNRQSVATTQDGIIRVACVLYNADEIIRGFDAIGYELVDRWQALESSLFIPGYPEYSVPEYSGMFFRLNAISTRGG